MNLYAVHCRLITCLQNTIIGVGNATDIVRSLSRLPESGLRLKEHDTAYSRHRALRKSTNFFVLCSSCHGSTLVKTPGRINTAAIF